MKSKTSIRIFIFLFFIFGIGLFNSLKEDVTFSEFENRPLAQFPEFTINHLIDGTFTKEFETYVSDQFIGKTFWTGLKAKAAQAVFKQENNDVYFGKDGYLFNKSEGLTKQLHKNIATVNDFQEKNPALPITFLLAPTSVDLYPEKLPAFAKTGLHEEIATAVKKQLKPTIHFVDPLGQLQKMKASSIYFRTDHHWTTLGAFYSYQAVAKEMGLIPYALNDFQIEAVSTNFYGTFYAKANDHFVPPDTIEKFILKNPIRYEVDSDDKLKMDDLYEETFLQKRDQYSFFLGGNHAKTIITSNVNNGQKLLLIKDSYAHTMVPFLTNHFEEIHMLDLRYYHASIQQYIQDKSITEALVLYNAPNFAADTSIIYLKY